MRLDNDDPKVVERSAPRPRLTCTLMNSHMMQCHDCRSMEPIYEDGRPYFCFKEAGESRFNRLMKENRRNIQIGWTGSYLTEKFVDEKTDNDEGCEASGSVVQPTNGQPLDQMGVDGAISDGDSATEGRETAEVVGECYG
jgi:hypothetical protein